MGLTFTIHKKVSKLTAKLHGDSSQQSLEHKVSLNRTRHGEKVTETKSIPRESRNFPSPLECRVHLKLLKVFANLKQNISNQEGLFGISEEEAIISGQVPSDLVLTAVREKRWEVFVAHAADRFEKWWTCITAKDERKRLKLAEESLWSTAGALESVCQNTMPMKWTNANLPPVDVLMVLHSFMLNPRCFLQDCLRYSMLSIWKAGLPWDLIDQCIDESTYRYHTVETSRRAWEVTTGLKWDNTKDGAYKEINCPSCGASGDHRWTTADFDDLEDPFGRCTGYADKLFVASCEHCNCKITRNLLSARKLKSNLEDLQQDEARLPGTMLSLNGQAISSDSSSTIIGVLASSNELLNLKVRSDIITKIDSSLNIAAGKEATQNDLESIHQSIKSTLPSTATHTQKVQLDRFLATTTQPSIFSLSLAEAVIRQGVFIETMQSISWLFSPALDLTLGKLLSKYPHFFTIMAEHPDQIAVPTYAVDLAWHTHQLTPQSYYNYSIARTNGIFIDHDDKLGEGTLSDGFGFTKIEFEKLTHGTEEYSECLCWNCMTLQVVQASFPGIDAKKAEEKTKEQLARAQYQKLENDFAVEVDRARTMGKKMPDQQAFLQEYVWLYPDSRPVLN